MTTEDVTALGRSELLALIEKKDKKILEVADESLRWAKRLQELEARIERVRKAIEPTPVPKPDAEACDLSYMPSPEDIHNLAREKGWWLELDRGEPISSDSFQAKVALIHSELAEATEAVRDNKIELYYLADKHGVAKPEGMVVELADAVIRVWDTTGALSAETGPFVLFKVDSDTFPVLRETDSMLAAIAYLHRRASAIHASSTTSFSNFVSSVEYVAKQLGLDLDTAIKVKHHYNKGRDHRHGGRLA